MKNSVCGGAVMVAILQSFGWDAQAQAASVTPSKATDKQAADVSRLTSAKRSTSQIMPAGTGIAGMESLGLGTDETQQIGVDLLPMILGSDADSNSDNRSLDLQFGPNAHIVGTDLLNGTIPAVKMIQDGDNIFSRQKQPKQEKAGAKPER